MRALLLVSIAALVCLPFAAANPVPSMAIKMDQSSLSVNAANASQPVTFTGSVSVNKSAYISATVTLTAAVDSGWQATLSPASMTFTTTTPQSFSCKVVVPAGTPGGNESRLTVSGTVVSGFLQNTATATATIMVTGTLPPPTNQTANGTGGTKPSDGGNQTVVQPGLTTTYGPAGLLGYSYEQWAGIVAVVVVALVAVVIVVRARRRGKAVYTVDEAAND
jgi:hypothetical protein